MDRQQVEYYPPPKPKRAGNAGRGRVPGAKNKAKRTLPHYAITKAHESIPPIDVMLHHMRWYHEQAEKIHVKVVAASKTIKDKKQLEKVLKLLGEMGDFRQMAIAAAAAAAPYCHQKLATLTVQPETPGEKVIDLEMLIATPMALLDETNNDSDANATVIDATPDLAHT